MRRAGVAASLVTVMALGAVVAAQPAKSRETFDAAWTVIRDSHFDPKMNGLDWGAVRTELAPKAAAARTDDELRGVIRDMLGRLRLSHFAIIPSGPPSSAASAVDLSGDPGLDVRLVGGDLLVARVEPDGPASRAGIRTGWKLLSIDGRPVAELSRSLGADLPDRLRQVEAWRLVETRLRGPVGSHVAAMFDDGAKEIGVAIARRPEPGQPATVGHLPTMSVRVDSSEQRTPGGARVGLIRFNVWMPAIDAQVQRAVDRFRAARGIVLDLRGNPGGLAAMIMGVAGHFLSDRVSLGTMKTRDAELTFAANPRLVNAEGQRVEPFTGPVAILVDALTGSASECFAGGMQSLGRARVFGQTTMGQALPAFFHKLPNGDVLIHATGDFVTASGTRLEGRGVRPDDEVPLRRDDLLEGRDAALAAALAWLDR